MLRMRACLLLCPALTNSRRKTTMYRNTQCIARTHVLNTARTHVLNIACVQALKIARTHVLNIARTHVLNTARTHVLNIARTHVLNIARAQAFKKPQKCCPKISESPRRNQSQNIVYLVSLSFSRRICPYSVYLHVRYATFAPTTKPTNGKRGRLGPCLS